MFHMLVCFDLKPGVAIEQFRDGIAAFTDHLRSRDMAVAISPIGKRVADTPLDTDKERAHQYFVTMSFRDRSQSEKALDYLKQHVDPGESFHHAVYSRALNPIFICWSDI
jgi:hypothetical protein